MDATSARSLAFIAGGDRGGFMNTRSVMLGALVICVAVGLLAYPLFDFLHRYISPPVIIAVAGLILVILRERDWN
jgi:hypothetical protein